QESERVVEREASLDRGALTLFVERGHHPAPVALGLDRVVDLRPGPRELVRAARLRRVLAVADAAVRADQADGHRGSPRQLVAEELALADPLLVGREDERVRIRRLHALVENEKALRDRTVR